MMFKKYFIITTIIILFLTGEVSALRVPVDGHKRMEEELISDEGVELSILYYTDDVTKKDAEKIDQLSKFFSEDEDFDKVFSPEKEGNHDLIENLTKSAEKIDKSLANLLGFIKQTLGEQSVSEQDMYNICDRMDDLNQKWQAENLPFYLGGPTYNLKNRRFFISPHKISRIKKYSVSGSIGKYKNRVAL